jgi:hypothetical protein
MPNKLSVSGLGVDTCIFLNRTNRLAFGRPKSRHLPHPPIADFQKCQLEILCLRTLLYDPSVERLDWPDIVRIEFSECVDFLQ